MGLLVCRLPTDMLCATSRQTCSVEENSEYADHPERKYGLNFISLGIVYARLCDKKLSKSTAEV